MQILNGLTDATGVVHHVQGEKAFALCCCPMGKKELHFDADEVEHVKEYDVEQDIYFYK